MSRKFIKLASLGLYVLAVLLFFVVGLYTAKISGAGKNQMLAGGAIVLMWGLMFALAAFVVSLIVVGYASQRIIVRLNWILLVLVFGLYGYGYYNLSTRTHKETPKIQEPVRTKAPEANTKPLEEVTPATVPVRDKPDGPSLGIGMFRPDFFKFPTLYFYGVVQPERDAKEQTPIDSIVFSKDPYGNPYTTYSPPWLYPEFLKPDYGIFIIKALGINRDFIEVEANKSTGRKVYLDKNKGTFLSWPEFLLTIHSIEFPDNQAGIVRVKPMEHASKVNVAFNFMQPLVVEQDWILVKLLDENYEELGQGWIRWKRDDILLIKYVLLS